MKFIAYFDFLGYKDFILNNDSDFIHKRVLHMFRDIEMALSDGKTKKSESGLAIADISNSKINCINISDSVIFWTNNDELEDLEQLLKVADRFNWQENLYNFPVRGAIIYDDIELIKYSDSNEVGGNYFIDTLFGKGLVKAYTKASNLNIAGCVIDKSVIDKTVSYDIDINELLEPYAIIYDIPYKSQNGNVDNEYFLRLTKGTCNEFAFKNTVDLIHRAFDQDNKDIKKPRAQEIFGNTIKYLEIFRSGD